MGDVAAVVADADVLAADLLVEGPARDALDIVRAHSWMTLLASELLLDDATAVIQAVSDAGLAADWREKITEFATIVDHAAGDHPAIAAAYHGGARHILSFDEQLHGAAAAVTIRDQVETSVKHPAGFVRLFDAESLYTEVVGGDYPGPDRDPRA